MTTDLGARLRRIRQASGKSQPALAAELGVGLTLISECERGLRVPDDRLIRAWCWAAGSGDQESELIGLAARSVLRPVHIGPDRPPSALNPSLWRSRKRTTPRELLVSPEAQKGS